MRRGRWWSLWLLFSSAGCGQQNSAAEAQPSLTCHPNDGRCGVCSWEENGVPRCRVTIFVGGCPPAADTSRSSCPQAPVASCDRSSSPGYLEGEDGFGDVDFYYGLQDLTQAENECAMSSGLEEPVWTVYE